MAGSPELNLSLWSFDDLCACHDEITETLALVLKAKGTVKPTQELEQRLAKELGSAWKTAASKSLTAPLRSLLSKKPTAKSIENFVNRLGVALAKPLTKKQVASITSRLTAIWKKAKAIAAREAKFRFTFDRPDRVAIDALTRHQVFWVGNFYSEHLGRRIAAVSSDVLIEQGLGIEEAGKTLEDALRREFGITAGGRSPFARTIPARYAGSPDRYFRQVASNAAHTARTFSKMQAFSEAGIIRYELINPNDERTGRVCQQMHGQVFSVAAGVKQMQNQLAAKTPDEVKAAAPWLTAKELETAIDGAPAGSRSATERLEAAGASVLPPFHGECRTEPVIID